MKENQELVNEIEELQVIKKAMNNMKKTYLNIPDTKFKQNVKNIINWLDKIYAEIFSDNIKLKKFRMYGDYYLPTITDLIDRYNVIKAKKLTSEDAINIINKIEETIEKLEEHFKRVYNGFFENEILDLDAEIKVLLHEIK